MFALALVAAPLLVTKVGLPGLFTLTCALALLGAAVVVWWVPAEPAKQQNAPRGRMADVWKNADLMRLNLGVFVLHTVQMAMWMAVPALLVRAGLGKDLHWQVYLPTVLVSFIFMGAVFSFERRGRLRGAMLLSIALVLLVQLGLGGVSWAAASGPAPGIWTLGLLLFVFFCGFNALEATQPSLVSRMAPASFRGAALGMYNTQQSLGLFAGGALGGALLHWGGGPGLFVATAALTALWLLVTLPLRPVERSAPH